MEYDSEYDSDGSFEEYRDWWLDSEDRNNLSDDEILDRMVEDTLYHEESFELFIQDLQFLLERLNTVRNLFFITGDNVGWRGMSGEGFERISEPRELVDTITPNSGSFRVQYTFNESDTTIHFKVSSHDSPSGSVFRVMPVGKAVEQAFETDGRKAALEEWYDD